MKNLYCFLSLALFLNLFIIKGAFASIPEGINLTKTSDGYDIYFTLPSFEIGKISAEGNEYDQLLIPGYGVTPEVGLPALPLISFVDFNARLISFPISEVLSTTCLKKSPPFSFSTEI